MQRLMLMLLVCGLNAASLHAFNKQPFGMSTIDNLSSDHEAFVIAMPLGGKSGMTKINVLSWNTWARGTRGGFDDNTPGYSLRVEPNANQRIGNNFASILEFMKNNSNSIVALQEIGASDLKQLSTLGNDVVPICSTTKGESFNTCIIYKTTEFELKGTPSSNNISSINALKTEIQPAIDQQDRYTHLQLLNKISGEIVDIINIHLKWQSKADDIITALNSYFNGCKGTCIITGDFNQNLKNSNASLNNATIFVYENGSISSFNKQRIQNTTDAIVYKLGSNK